MRELADHQYRRLFKASPGKILVLLPPSFEIVAATDEYLKATLTRESDIVGKALFDVFPDNPDDQHADGARNLLSSLQRVMSLKTPEIMGIQRYPIRHPDGTFEERFWSPVNSPVLDDTGEIEFIFHRAEDVTDIVRAKNRPADEETGDNNRRLSVEDVLLRSQELRQALSKLQEHEARMRTAVRMLHLGTWEFQPSTGTLNWSRQVFEIYDVPYSKTAPDFEAYFTRVHPDDQEAARAVYSDFAEKNAAQIEFEHRVIADNGEVRYIKGVGERHLSSDGELVVGYVQDITPLITTRHELTQAQRLFRLAGEKARLGGWRVELDSDTHIWTPETASIHGLPPGYSPANVDEAIQYYAPEYRAVIRNAFEQCVREGKEFSVICQLHTPDGRKPWVRAIGMAERDQTGRVFAVQGAFQDISPLREAQARADEAEQRRRDVLESVSDAFYALDDQWHFTYLNKKAGVLLERDREELLGNNVWEEFPAAAGTQIQFQYEWALENQQTARFFEHYIPLDKWFEINAYPIPDGLAVYFRDVTSEREHQEQLRLAEAALSHQNDTVIITEADPIGAPDGPRIVYVNEAFERLTGYTQQEAIGRTPHFLQGQETDRQQLDRIRTALTQQEPVRSELLNYNKSGQSYWLELEIAPLFDAEGHCTHYVSVQRDITQRMQQDSELRRAQERFELISRATSDVVWDWNLMTNEVWWNDSMTEVFGYVLSELEPGPESWSCRIHPEDLNDTIDSIHAVIAGENEYWRCEYRFIRQDGRVAQVIDRGFVIRDESGKAVRMVGSMLDITGRIDMEERLRESQKLEALGHLTGGVTHDFNNLLTVILGNAELLAERSTDQSLRSMAEMTLTAARRGSELTNRLLAFARRQPLNPTSTDLNQVIDATRALVRRTLPENIELEFIPDSELGITEIDAGELDTALLNLVINARDAMQGGGKLTIETANAVLDSDYANHHSEVNPGEYVMICVSDTGIGMDSNTLHRAFEPFFTTKGVGKGSGLGLSMVYGFTKQSGGHIKIYSEPGEGSSVRLYFPRIRTARQTSYQALPESNPRGGTEHILIAEDDDLVMQYLKGQLKSLGYRVTAVSSGPEALRALQLHGGFDLLLTDIIMPGGMNGRELADRAISDDPTLKVLFSSGYTENAIVHHGRLDPGVDLLGKPYTRIELASKVRLVLDKEVKPTGGHGTRSRS